MPLLIFSFSFAICLINMLCALKHNLDTSRSLEIHASRNQIVFPFQIIGLSQMQHVLKLWQVSDRFILCSELPWIISGQKWTEVSATYSHQMFQNIKNKSKRRIKHYAVQSQCELYISCVTWEVQTLLKLTNRAVLRKQQRGRSA